MSFEIYVMSGENEDSELPTLDDLAGAFGPAAKRGDDGWLKLEFEDDFCDCHFSLDDRSCIKGFTVFRPVQAAALWDGLFQLLSRYHFFVVWPGDCGPVLARSDTRLPDGLTEELGDAVIVERASEIPELIKGS